MSNVNKCMEGEVALPTNTNAVLALSEDNTTSNSEIKYNDNINMIELNLEEKKMEIPKIEKDTTDILIEQFQKFYRIAIDSETKNLPIWARCNDKCPVFQHKDFDIYSGKCYEEYTQSIENPSKYKQKIIDNKYCLNLLMDDLIAIDTDSQEAEEWFNNNCFINFEEEFEKCPIQKTSKGYHHIFRRPENCDMFYKARAFKDDDDNELEIDCITTCSTGTRGNLNIFPSNNKKWIKPINSYEEIPVMSDELYQFWYIRYIGIKEKNSKKNESEAPKVNNEIIEFTEEEKNTKIFKMADAIPLKLLQKGSYTNWMRIIYSLASVGEYKIAKYLSMKSEEAYDEAKFNELYNGYSPDVPGANGKSISILSLYDCVKQHSPEEFKKINKKFNKKSKKDDDLDDDDTNIEDDYDNITNGKCADIFWDYFSNKYSFSGINWYRFNDSGIYEDINKIHTHILRRDIVVAMSKWEQNQIQSITAKYEEGEINLKEMKALRKKIFKKVRSIESDTFLKQCIGSLSDKFLDEGLEEKLDKNYTKLFAFKNGVYDFENKIFRKATKEDYVSNFVPYNYDETDIDHDYFDNLINMIFSDSYSENDVYGENEKAKFFKIHLGSLIEGGNREEKVYFWVGKGRNGKGVQDHLLQKTLGDTNSGYYGSIDPTYFTTKNDDVNKATPVKMNFYKRRLVVAQEPNGSQEKEDKFQEGNFKSQSGNDKMSGRHLRGNTVYWYPTHKTIIPTNHLPYFTGKSDGLFERIVIIKFDNKFEVNFNKNDPKQRPANIKLKESLIDKEAKFFNYLLHWFWIYKKEGLKNIPKEFENERKKYIQSLHTVRSYINENLETTDKKDEYVSTSHAYNDFIKYVDSTISQTVFCNEIKNEGIIINRIRKEEYGKTQQIRVLLGYKFKITENVTINIEPEPSKNDKCLIKDDEEDTLSMNSTKNEDDDDELNNVLVNKLG